MKRIQSTPQVQTTTTGRGLVRTRASWSAPDLHALADAVQVDFALHAPMYSTGQCRLQYPETFPKTIMDLERPRSDPKDGDLAACLSEIPSEQIEPEKPVVFDSGRRMYLARATECHTTETRYANWLRRVRRGK
jgi:hypothetical protein